MKLQPFNLVLLSAATLLVSCSSVSTQSLISAASTGSPEAAVKSILRQKEHAYLRDPAKIARDMKAVQRDFERLVDVLRGNAGKKWGKQEAHVPDRTHYVKYTQGYLSRTIVDFDSGEITVETLDQNNPDKSLKEAIVVTLLTPDDPRSVDLFSDQPIRLTSERPPYLLGLVLDEKGHAIDTPERAERFASAQAESAQMRNVSTDAGNRQARWVRFAMVGNFSNRQAEKYRPLVEKYAKAYGISPSLVFAIMRTESNFNPFAVSSAPAYGLMQLAPASGGRDAYRRAKGVDHVPGKQYLFDAENNIELGTAYLSVLAFDELDEIADPVSREYCVISAYNTGPTNVLRTFSGSRVQRDAAIAAINGMAAPAIYDRLRRQLPYAETRQYLQKVVDFRRQFVTVN